jgi:hypothetical protein
VLRRKLVSPSHGQALEDDLARSRFQRQTPKYEEIWSSDCPEDNLATVCFKCLSFINVAGSRIAQFAHYSVKEFLTSERISKFETKVARYRMLEEPAHITVARMCVAVLLYLDERTVRNADEEIL